jgi:hypothetical protein
LAGACASHPPGWRGSLGDVASLNPSGASTTTYINFEYRLCGKWLEKLTQIAPYVKHVAVRQDPGPSAVWAAQFKESKE